MSTTCQICGSAMPKSEQAGGHTALCAGVAGEQLGVAVVALRLIARTNATECAYPRTEAAEALCAIDKIVRCACAR
jgi:hypothetical protein